MCCCYNECKKAFACYMFSIVFLIIAIILIVIFINNNPIRNENILVATAVSRR